MSRIGRKPVPVPAGVNVNINGSEVTVKGKKGELTRTFHPEMTISREDENLLVTRPSDQRQHRALHGLTRALLNNMVVGVTDGFRRDLVIEGVGYRAELADKTLVLHLGYSHDIRLEPSPTISFEVPKESKGQLIIITGIDKQEVGEIAAYIRKQRPPEPYLGKGVRYSDEVIRRKEGKTGKGK